MKLGAFLEKHKAALPPNMGVDHVAVKHPETGAKIYIVSAWRQGFWYRKVKGSCDIGGQMWPCGWSKDLLQLQVHPSATKELGLLPAKAAVA